MSKSVVTPVYSKGYCGSSFKLPNKRAANQVAGYQGDTSGKIPEFPWNMKQATPEIIDHPVSTAFIGRQPIFNAAMDVYAYELLFRSGNENAAGELDGNQATAQVIYNTLIEIGLDELTGTNLAFINFTHDLLIRGVSNLLPPERVVIEVLEDVELTSELIDGVRQLARRGFTIALDDFVFAPEWEPLIDYADIIKLDVNALSMEEVSQHVVILRQYNVKLLAEKVETREEFAAYRDMGFDYFQGYFFSRPSIISKEKLPDNHLALLQLLARLQDPDIDIDEIEVLVSQTVSLSYKLFRYINSAFYGFTRKFDSIRQAVVYFGLQRLKDLACLIAMSGINNNSSELIITGLSRAKLCESLARETGHTDSDAFFVVGLFSILEALLDIPLAEIIDKLPLNDEVMEALLDRQGAMGEVLNCSIACEQCDMADIRYSDVDSGRIYKMYLNAFQWADQAAAGLSA